MTSLALAVIFVAILLIYAGVKGLSFTRLLVGDNGTPATPGTVAG